MRSLIFISAIILLFSSCSNQEEIVKYQRQLRESNEALEEIIEYRRVNLLNRARENPARALKWLKVTEVYDSICKGLTYGKSLNNQTLSELKLISDTLFLNNRPEDMTFENNNLKDSLLIKNIVLNHLNKWLQRMVITTDPNFCGWKPLTIKPTFMVVGDSTLVNLTSNFCLNQNKYVVSIDVNDHVDFKESHSLGYFMLPAQMKNFEFSGNVEFLEHSAMRAFKLYFNNDTTYFIQ